MLRTRWAAIGAAVAVTLGAGGIGLVSATSPSDAVTFVPIEPCRLFDTRPDFQVGPRSAPLGPNETFTVVAHGDNGQCTGIPATATGLGMNVTAVSPSQATVLTIWGAGDRPNASSLNPTPGQPPTPNAVTSGLTGAGQLNVWNAFGSVHVLVDIVGYYTDHNHDDRYYTEAEVYNKAEVDGLIAPETIVLRHSTSDIEDHSSGDTVNSFGTGGFLTGGFANLGITGPAMIGADGYRLASLEYCLQTVTSGTITTFNVWQEGPDANVQVASDPTDRNAVGCYTVEVPAHDPVFSYDVQWQAAAGSSIRVSGLQSTWVPIG